MKTPVFTGTCTALITPFQASGSIDYAAFARQMDRQLGIRRGRAVSAAPQGKVPPSLCRNMSIWWITACHT